MLDNKIASTRDLPAIFPRSSSKKIFSGLLEILPPCHNSKQEKNKIFFAALIFKNLRVSNINDVHFQCKNKNLCFEVTEKMKKICINVGKKLTVAYGFIFIISFYG